MDGTTSNSKLTVHGCTFDKCTAADGGGIFACATEQLLIKKDPSSLALQD